MAQESRTDMSREIKLFLPARGRLREKCRCWSDQANHRSAEVNFLSLPRPCLGRCCYSGYLAALRVVRRQISFDEDKICGAREVIDRLPGWFPPQSLPRLTRMGQRVQ